MKQSRAMSLAEAVTNVAVGFGAAVLAQLIVFPWFRLPARVSDTLAMGALSAIEAAGLSCPDDIAVVSFDGLVEAHQTSPSLTTVAQPVRRTGQEAVELLLDVLDQEPDVPPRTILPTELLVRSSCGCGD